MASTTIWRWWSEIVDDGDDGGEIVGSGDNCDGEDKIVNGVEAKNCKLLLMKVIGGEIINVGVWLVKWKDKMKC